jgi:hypothetical protein
VQTIVHTKTFEVAAKECGLTEKELEALEMMLAENPDAGDLIQGSGGCRKVRLAGRGKGKSGGYRVITLYSAEAMPVYLLYAYSKGDRDDLSDSQISALKAAAKTITEGHRRRLLRGLHHWSKSEGTKQ